MVIGLLGGSRNGGSSGGSGLFPRSTLCTVRSISVLVFFAGIVLTRLGILLLLRLFVAVAKAHIVVELRHGKGKLDFSVCIADNSHRVVLVLSHAGSGRYSICKALRIKGSRYEILTVLVFRDSLILAAVRQRNASKLIVNNLGDTRLRIRIILKLVTSLSPNLLVNQLGNRIGLDGYIRGALVNMHGIRDIQVATIPVIDIVNSKISRRNAFRLSALAAGRLGRRRALRIRGGHGLGDRGGGDGRGGHHGGEDHGSRLA